MSSKIKTYEIIDNHLSDDFLISHYKSKLLHKTRTSGNISELQIRYRKLQSEMEKISYETLKLKFEIEQTKETGTNNKNELQKKNEDLIKQIRDKEIINKQLYSDNRILSYELEKKITENNKLYDEIMNQYKFLTKIKYDKGLAESKFNQLNKIRENHHNNLSNLNFKMNKLNIKSDEQKKAIDNKTKENNDLINQINKEKNMSNNLKNELIEKNKNINLSKLNLTISNDDMNKLENEFDKMKNISKKNDNELNIINNNLIKEKEIKEEIENNNKIIENDILKKDEIIQKEKEHNSELNKDVNQLQYDNNFLEKEIEGFKKHIYIISKSNKSLVKELENILARDKNLEYTFDRDNILENIKEQNMATILNSRKNINNIMNEYDIDNNDNNNININKSMENKLTYEINNNENNNSNYKSFKENEK